MARRYVAAGGPTMGEVEVAAARRVILSGSLSQGREVERLEEDFAEKLGARHAVAVSSGSAALELAMRAHGIGPGDEVVTTPFSFFATVGSVLRVGARPVFADIDPLTGNLDPDAVASQVTGRTAAILPVHLYGRPCDLDALRRTARRHQLVLVEDACQAIGARFRSKSVGAMGTGCFSFYGSKNITSGEGGMITVTDSAVAAKLRRLRSHGSGGGNVHRILSSNYRLTDLQGAILRVQLKRLGSITQRRQRLAQLYDGLIDHPDVSLPPQNDSVFESCYHQYTIRVTRNRDRLRRTLAAAGVDARVYYPRPIHRQPVWTGSSSGLPAAELLALQVLSIPIHPAVANDDARYIAEILNGPAW